ncbi:MAG: hypothetical protein ACRD38_12170, partial [Nitrososphaerales archaeon]
MSSEPNVVSRPVIIMIIIALVGMSTISSILVYTSQQNTEGQIDLIVSQERRAQLIDEVIRSSAEAESILDRIGTRLQIAADNPRLRQHAEGSDDPDGPERVAALVTLT